MAHPRHKVTRTKIIKLPKRQIRVPLAVKVLQSKSASPKKPNYKDVAPIYNVSIDATSHAIKHYDVERDLIKNIDYKGRKQRLTEVEEKVFATLS